MKKFYTTILNAEGQPVAGGTVQVKDHFTGSNRVLYADDEVTTTINPAVSDADGVASFKCLAGLVDLIVTGGAFSKTFTNVEISDSGSSDSDQSTARTVMAVSQLTGGTFVAVTGSGESKEVLSDGSTLLTVGSTAKNPGRIYAEGRKFYRAGQEVYLNGANTPWRTFNEFGATGALGVAVYDPAWWEDEFVRLENRGMNHTRVWINDNCDNQGIIINSVGELQSITPLFWSNLDDMLARANAHGIYVLVSVMSFDHYSWNMNGSEKYHALLGKLSNVEAWANLFMVPLALRHAANQKLFAIDLSNEMDNFYEAQDTATPKIGTCTPVGGGSTIVNFGFRQDDFVVGQNLYVNGVNMGAIVSRNTDTQVTATNGYPGASATFNPGGGAGWGWLGKNKATFQRYLAVCAAAIHNCAPVTPLVTVGVQSIKFSTTAYGESDYYSDAALSSFTGDSASKMDFHSIHYYQWAEPFFPLMASPLANGLSAKPAMWGELPAGWENLNGVSEGGQWVSKWWPNTYFQAGWVVYVDDGTNKRLYRCVTSGMSGPTSGVAGGDIGPTGTGSGIADGAAVWDYCANNSTFRGLHAYNAYSMIISFDGGVWVCTTGGMSSNSGGPYGVGPTFTDGAAVFTYRRQAILSETTLYEYLLANGWVGHAPWTSNAFGLNGGLYETTVQTMNIVADWTPSTPYAQNIRVFADGGKMYRCLTGGTSAASGGPAGTGAAISDGGATWCYAKTVANAPWTSHGTATLAFKDAHPALVFPVIPGGWNNSGTAYRQSKARGWVRPGGVVQHRLQVDFGLPQNILTQSVGAFDEANGLLLSMIGPVGSTSFQITMRIGGTPTVVSRSSWNVDRFDGTGPSGLSLALDGPITVVLEISPEAMFPNRLGFCVAGNNYWAHRFLTEFPLNPNLPARWEIGSSGGSLPNVSTLKSLDAVAVTNGERALSRRSSNGGFVATQIGSSSIVELAAFRVSALNLAKGTMVPVELAILGASSGGSYPFEWWISVNPTESIPTAWSGVSGSIVESTRGRALQDQGTRVASGFGFNSMQSYLKDMDDLLARSASAGDVLSIQVRNISGSENYFWFSLSWEEG